MQRDWNVIEEILEAAVESTPFEGGFELPLDKQNNEEIRKKAYHFGLLKEAGYIAETHVGIGEHFESGTMTHLTMKGHDLLEDLQNGDLPEAPRSRSY